MSKNDERSSSFAILILPSLHFLFCVWTDLFVGEDGFKWYLVGLIDFPVRIVVSGLPVTLTPFFEYTVVGTLWWLAVGALFKFVYKKMLPQVEEPS